MLNLIAYNLIRIPKLLTAKPTALTTSRSPHEFEDKKTEKSATLQVPQRTARAFGRLPGPPESHYHRTPPGRVA
jgi:hypothetical protein